MGFGDLGSSESSTSQRLSNQQLTASDQAVVVRAQGRAFQDDRDIRVGKGATLTINSGLDRADVQSLLAQANVNPNSADDGMFKEALLISLNKRVEANTERAVDEVTSAAPSKVKNYVAWAIGAVVVFALVVLFGGRKKS